MLNSETPLKLNSTKFPRISSKNKSLPSSNRNSINLMNVVTAKSWLYSVGQTQYGYKSSMRRDIASLTKIMTAFCVLEIAEVYKINIKTAYFRITEWSAYTSGTTANLMPNAWMTVEDFLYGLMLPSGNDAAEVLAQNLGVVLYFNRTGNQSLIKEIRSIDLTEDQSNINKYINQFVTFMNQTAKRLKMYKTHFGNPHGLDHQNNYSCCDDLLILSKIAIKNDIFKRIVRTSTHRGTFKQFKEKKVVCRYINWTNTNILLQKNNICGIKTGITQKAGGCLATMINVDFTTDAIVIVLGSSSTEARFKDTLKIISLIYQQKSIRNPE